LSPHKGHDDAISTIERLGAGFRLLIGGAGRHGYVEALKARTRDLSVEFAGFVQPADFLERINLLILPSWEEPFGIVVLKAMAAGVNVVATDAGGPSEIREGGLAGTAA
jgi:glycosyltransferase involved in cell wall biosynthesis